MPSPAASDAPPRLPPTDMFTPSNLQEWEDQFDLMDKDPAGGHKGYITPEELAQFAKEEFGEDLDAEDLRFVDKNDDGKITFAEFAAVAMAERAEDEGEKPPTPAEIRDIFDYMDKDKNGSLSEEELSKMINGQGDYLTPAELAELVALNISAWDDDGNHEISFDEFIDQFEM
eukprot:tig00021435_g21426.t1